MRAAAIPVRTVRFPVDATIPRAWCATSPLATNAINALSLIFPEGERFFIRSVWRYLPDLADDPELCARVRGFAGQEGRHGAEHDRLNRMLEAQGFDIEEFLRIYRQVGFERIEPSLPPHLRLATTAALEHLTATFAEAAIRTGILDDVHPVVGDLLRWHAAEEIEHKSVAFDVLMRVDPRHSTRLAGLGIGLVVLGGFWSLAFASLHRQDPDRAARPTSLEAAARFQREASRLRRQVRAALRDYVRPDFHPDQRDNAHLARTQLDALGL